MSPSGDGPPVGGRVVLVGMMGTGKSTVARLLASLLGCAVLDTDKLVESAAGLSVAEMFEEEGEAAFRAAEARAIAQAGQVRGPLVLSAGGGAVLSPANRRALRAAGTVVWLRGRPATLAQRVGTGHGRPLLAGHGGPDQGEPAGAAARLVEALEALEAARTHLYQEVADVVIDVDELSAAQVAQQLADWAAGRADGTGADGTGADGTGADGTGADGTGADGTGADGTGADGTGADGSGAAPSGSARR